MTKTPNVPLVPIPGRSVVVPARSVLETGAVMLEISSVGPESVNRAKTHWLDCVRWGWTTYSRLVAGDC